MAAKERFKLIAAVYLLLRRGEDEILLSKRANSGYQDGKYSLIAGHLNGDELATEGLVREAKEEAGITIKPSDLRFVHMVHGLNREQVGQERLSLFFEANKWQGEIKIMEPEKCDDLSWHKIDKLPDNMLPLVKLVLQDVANGIHYSQYSEEPV